MSTDRSLTRASRVIRSSIVSFSAVLVAAISHMAAGGNTPTGYAIGAGTIVVLPLVMLFTSSRFGVLRTFTSVALTQVLFHWMFVSLGVTNPTTGPGEPLPAHAHHFDMMQNFVPMATAGSGAEVAMWLSHLVAAAVTVGILRRGERALDTIQSALSRLLFGGARATPVVPVSGAPLRVSQTSHTAGDQRELWPSISHRGPPAEALTQHHSASRI